MMNEAAQAVRTLKVLVVDDEDDIRRLCGDVFRSEGFDVTVAETAHEGARLATGEPFDVGIIDERLPDGRGTALIRWLHRRFPEMTLILFSAYADWQLYFRACSCGAKDVVAKAFSPSELVRIVRHCTHE